MHIDNFFIMSFTGSMIKRPTNDKPTGFTLIELLIVIAVIGILAASVLALINPLEQFAKARDAERKNTLRELANALERYMIKNRIYPVTGPGIYFSSELGDGFSNNGGNWIPGLEASNEITRLPRDPKGGPTSIIAGGCAAGGWQRAYLYVSADGSCYKLLSHCAPEAAGAFSPTDAFFDPQRPDYAWMVCEPPGSICCTY